MSSDVCPSNVSPYHASLESPSQHSPQTRHRRSLLAHVFDHGRLNRKSCRRRQCQRPTGRQPDRRVEPRGAHRGHHHRLSGVLPSLVHPEESAREDQR